MLTKAHWVRRLAVLPAIWALASGLLTSTSPPAASATVLAARSISNVAPPSEIDGYQWATYFRGMAGLGPVKRDVSLQADELKHVQYLANHALPCEVDVHNELTARQAGCGANPYATAAGKAAANNSNITRVSTKVSDRTAVSNWFSAAFHALVLLDPRLTTTGYASYYTPKPTGAKPLAWSYTAGIDVYRGRTGQYNGQTIAFPGNGSATPLLSYNVGTESPEPFRTSAGTCSSWGSKSVVSAPIIVQQSLQSAASLKAGLIIDLSTGHALSTCTLTAASYPVASTGRQFLDGSNGITRSALYYGSVPFIAGHRYQLRIGGAAVTTFYATSLPSSVRQSTLAVTAGAEVSWTAPSTPAGTRGLHFFRVVAYKGNSCAGAATTAVNSLVRSATLRLARATSYSVRVATSTGTTAGRWSNCVHVKSG